MALKPKPRETRLFRLLTSEPRSAHLDFYSDLVSLPDLRSRTRFLALNLFPQPVYMAKRYGVDQPWALPFLYVFRFGQGLVRFGRTVPQALRLGR
jgi:hypothetical protein